MSSIKSKTEFENVRTVQYNTNIGYVSDGLFVPATVTTAALNYTDIARNMPVKFIVPINLNPNSSMEL